MKQFNDDGTVTVTTAYMQDIENAILGIWRMLYTEVSDEEKHIFLHEFDHLTQQFVWQLQQLHYAELARLNGVG